ncbi:MAG: HD domain-containing protein [Dehalococcoidia bacterium]
MSVPGLPPAVTAALRAVAGDDHAVWVVGGYIRDQLLQRPVEDADLAVAGDPRFLANAIGAGLDGAVFPLSHEHGAWRVTLRHPIDGLAQLDITAMRGSIEADLRGRDFTINAVAALPEGGQPVDPFDGIADLRTRTIRLVSAEAIRADPLRALRGVRHAAELGFTIDPASAQVIARDAGLIVRAAGERQRDELLRALDTPRGAESIRLLDRLTLLDHVIPELEATRGCTQPKEHYWNVFDHSVETVAVLDCILAPTPTSAFCRRRVEAIRRHWPPQDADPARWSEPIAERHTRRALLKLTGLLHDVSKPETRTVEPDGRIRFFGHPDRGAAVVGAILRRLRFSAREVKLAELLIREHLRPGQLAAPGEVPTARALYRFFRDLDGEVSDLLALNLADGAAAAGPRQRPHQWEAHTAYTGWILRQRIERQVLTKPKRLVTGNDLIAELGMAQGPELGRILAALTEAEAAGEVTTRGEALDYARVLREAGS